MWPECGLELGNLQVEQTHQHGSQQVLTISVLLANHRNGPGSEGQHTRTSTARQQVVDCSHEVNIVLMLLIRQCFD